MTCKQLMPMLLATLLAAPAVHAQAASPGAAATQGANAVDPAAVQALKDMGAYLQTLKRFRVTTDASGEVVLQDGQKLQNMATATVDVVRPNKLRVRMVTARSERVLYYNGKTATLYTPGQKSFSSVAFTDNLAGLTSALQEKYGIEIPLSDLFTFGTPAAQFDKIESAMNAGQAFVGDDLTNHYAFRSGKLDWQIWIMTGKQPLPLKIVITNRSDEARPQSESLLDWDLKPTFQDSIFTFVPPKGVTKAEIVPLKTKK